MNVPILRVISVKLYIVLSAYVFNSLRDFFTSFNVDPSLLVFASIVCIEPICVSYSCIPVFTGSIVRAETILLPALTAELVMLDKAVTPITCSAENLACTASTAVPIPLISIFFDAESISVNPLAHPVKFNFCLNRSRVDIVVCTLDSNCLLSNCIDTTLSSTVLLII